MAKKGDAVIAAALTGVIMGVISIAAWLVRLVLGLFERRATESETESGLSSRELDRRPPPPRNSSQEERDDWSHRARIAQVHDVRKMACDLDIKIGLMHVSALLPSTRPSHAERHGKIFTPDEVETFWADPENRKGCTCAVVQALLDSDGNPILTDCLQQNFRAELASWRSGGLAETKKRRTRK